MKILHLTKQLADKKAFHLENSKNVENEKIHEEFVAYTTRLCELYHPNTV